jgi:SAM-dependent methyltransferase
MKTKSIIISFLMAVFSYANLSALIKSDQEYEVQSRRIEAWEKKINEERQPPEKVMDAIGVKPGMIIGEVGAGRGRYTVHLARRVGSEGKIFANDIDESALSYLRERCRRNNIQNIETILGTVDDPLFPERSLDMVMMVWVYHMLEQPIPLMKNLRTSLKPGATVVILDPPDDEIDAEMRELKGKLDPDRPTIKERIEKGGAEAGFELVRIETFLPKDTIYILKVKSNQ